MKRIFAILALVLLASATAATAQQCQAFASYRGQPFQAYGAGNFTDNTTFVGAGLGYGGRNAFGNIQLGSMNHDQFGSSSVAFGGGGGYDVAVNQSGSVHLCPMGSLGFQVGPHNINGSGVNYSETDVSLGVGAGYLTSPSRQIDLIPMASLSIANNTDRFHSPSGVTTTTSDAYGVLGLGLGVIVNKQVSFRPSVGLPFGGGTTVFGVSMGVNWGR